MEAGHAGPHQAPHTSTELVTLSKAHVLTFLELPYCIAHTSPSTMHPLDATLGKFPRETDMNGNEAPLHFHIAPLAARRDIAVPGIQHRATLGLGPAT